MKNWFIFLFVLNFSCTKEKSATGELTAAWQLLPFDKIDSVNPVLDRLATSTFYCPVRMDSVHWEAKDVFNPSAVVRNDTVYLLYRAEDRVGKYAGTSRLGLAYSHDGLHFQRLPSPVFYPAQDSMKIYEWEGGVEDPRLIEDEQGNYLLTYTAYDGKTARLCVARSTNLMNWTKEGLAFSGDFKDLWSKSGAIVTEQKNERFVASRIYGKYWMYWGDTDIFLASSDDLIHWNPVVDEKGIPLKVFGPRPGNFDSDLVEPGPQAILTEKGIRLLYNSRNSTAKGTHALPDGNYAAGQVLLSASNPAEVIDRMKEYFLTPDRPYELSGQVNNVCFIEGLVYFHNRWFLYYGTADSKIAVAVH